MSAIIARRYIDVEKMYGPNYLLSSSVEESSESEISHRRMSRSAPIGFGYSCSMDEDNWTTASKSETPSGVRRCYSRPQ